MRREREDAWQETELDRLREMWAAGLSGTEMAKALHRSKNSVIGKVHRLQLPPRANPVGGRPYSGSTRMLTDEGKAEFTRLWLAGTAAREIGMVLDLSRSSVISLAHRLGLPPHTHPQPLQIDFSSEEHTRIRELRAHGLPWRVIAHEFGCSIMRIEKEGRALGLETTRREPVATLPALMSVSQAPVVLPRAKSAPVLLNFGRFPKPEHKREIVVLPPRYIPPGGCLFPLWGNNEAPTHLYCDAPKATRTYCEAHSRICWINARIEAAAAKAMEAAA